MEKRYFTGTPCRTPDCDHSLGYGWNSGLVPLRWLHGLHSNHGYRRFLADEFAEAVPGMEAAE